MNIDKILKLFVPKDHSFFPLFEESSDNLLKASELLVKLISSDDPEERERISKIIKEHELKGDHLTQKAYDHLNSTFITPFDREDIHELTSTLDNVLDSINSISRRIILYKPLKLDPVFLEMSVLIQTASSELNTAIHYLKDASARRKSIIQACRSVKECEHKSDELYFTGIMDIFEKVNDTKELLKISKIMENLEKCVDRTEDVSDTIKSILVKLA